MKEARIYEQSNRVYTMDSEGAVRTFLVMANGDLLLNEQKPILPVEARPTHQPGRRIHLSEDELETIHALRDGTAAVVPRAVADGIQLTAEALETPTRDSGYDAVLRALLIRAMGRYRGEDWAMKVDDIDTWINKYRLSIKRDSATEYIQLLLHDAAGNPVIR
jgi:hypothetical protein